ncbi:hypothetical protein HK102_012572, partial [Quaeritorhiza haematococci]
MLSPASLTKTLVVLILLCATVYTQNVTIKIGSSFVGRPRANESVLWFGTVDVNRFMLAQQALLNHWNQNNKYYPPNVTFEIVWGGHNGNAGAAILECVRLIDKEKVAFYISHSPSPTVISEQNIINIFNTLHCATTATANELSDKGVAKTFYRTTAPTKYWGYAVAEFLMKWNLRRVAVLAEEGSVCQDWAQYIKSVRDSGGRIVVHCGQVPNAFHEAAKQGYIQKNEMFFIATPSNMADTVTLRSINFTHIIPHLYGSMAIEVGRNDVPPPNDFSTFIESDVLAPIAANPPFVVRDTAPRKEDTLFSSCLYTAIPAMSEVVKRGLVTWSDIANGALLTKVPFARFMQVMNEVKLPGFGGKPFAFDPKTADPTNELYITN